MSSGTEPVLPRRQTSSVPSLPNVIETARKRAVLLTEIVSHLARYRIALAKLAELERRQGNPVRAGDLEDFHRSVASVTDQFGIDADDAHAQWRNLNRLHKSAFGRPSEV
jgi:hypothetical protein